MRKARGGGFNNAAVSYRDGEIVGAAAPELGQENKGRAMLEKMGWSTGTALGALNNKGIMQPLAHVVKTTKAGLGWFSISQGALETWQYHDLVVAATPIYQGILRKEYFPQPANKYYAIIAVRAESFSAEWTHRVYWAK